MNGRTALALVLIVGICAICLWLIDDISDDTTQQVLAEQVTLRQGQDLRAEGTAHVLNIIAVVGMYGLAGVLLIVALGVVILLLMRYDASLTRQTLLIMQAQRGALAAPSETAWLLPARQTEDVRR